MTISHLLARGFSRSHLSPFTGFCGKCQDYRTFTWWQSPMQQGGFDLVVACKSCSRVPRTEHRLVEKHPVTTAVAS